MHRLVLALLGLTMAVPALAQDAEDCLLDPNLDCEDVPNVVYRDRTEIDFETVDVNAPLTRPSIAMLGETRHKGFNPLIRFRTDFDPELWSSVSYMQ